VTTTTPNSAALAYFATPGPLTDLRAHASRARDLPHALADLCRVVQGLVVHPFLAHLYGLEPTALRHDELEIRAAAEMLERMLALDSRPLDEPRPPERRFVGNCRHFTVLLCAFLRARGAPARARCGFGAYFDPPRFEDHWVCEVWDEVRGSWRMVDAQLDARQCEALRIPFDPLDVPRTQFLVAGDAWQRCRSGREDPERFGILDLRGLWVATWSATSLRAPSGSCCLGMAGASWPHGRRATPPSWRSSTGWQRSRRPVKSGKPKCWISRIRSRACASPE
jgi:hypothetical protein